MVTRPSRISRRIDGLREALSRIQKELHQCNLHKGLCTHGQDALKIANDALLTDADISAESVD